MTRQFSDQSPLLYLILNMQNSYSAYLYFIERKVRLREVTGLVLTHSANFDAGFQCLSPTSKY